MKKGAGKFSFKVPEGHPEAGNKIEKAFEYDIVETEAEATDIIAKKKWKLLDLVNDTLKANTRSSVYQAALLPYRPSEVDPEDIKERMVRDYIRMGLDEDTARKTVNAALSLVEAKA